MTRIRATCPECGEVDLRPDDVELDIVRDAFGEESVGDGSCYRFACPGCEDIIEKPADARIARLLTTGGVAVSVNGVAEPRPEHPECPPEGPAFTYDDLLDFHQLLSTSDWYLQLRDRV